VVEVVVPDDAEIRGMAERLHAARLAYHGTLAGWPVRYSPRVEARLRQRVVRLSGGAYFEDVAYVQPASFMIGEYCCWHYSLIWENGDTASPRRHDGFEHVIAVSFAREG
jgi:hypothetical protein